MCLAIPGKIISIDETDELIRMGKVDFGGIKKNIALAYTPEAMVGQYVLTHVGFAISLIDETLALKVLDEISQ